MCLGEDLCPSGPHCWRQAPLHELSRNLPLRIGGVGGPRATPELLERAWAYVHQSIDKGHPCFGWHWEWVPIKGYDSEGYLYPDGATGPKDWAQFGAKAIGFLELYSVQPGTPASDEKTIHDALAFAIAWAESPDQWTMDDYQGGLAAYDTWIGGLRSGKATTFGLAYHAAIWSECRGFAVEFLKEADTCTKGRYPALKDAIHHYTAVHDALAAISSLRPWGKEGTFDERKARAESRPLEPATRDRIIALLETAKKAETAGIADLKKVVQAIESNG
jgi:hypothetical protein